MFSLAKLEEELIAALGSSIKQPHEDRGSVARRPRARRDAKAGL
jgi:hypothetical protein